MDDILVVVVAQTTTQFLVVHFRFVLPGSPATSNFFWINQLELPLTSGPGYAVLAVTISQQLQQKLPELDGPRSRGIGSTYLRGGARTGRRVRAIHGGVKRGGTWGRHGGTSWRGVWGGTIGEGRGSRTWEWIRRRLEETSIGCEGRRVHGEEVILGDHGVMDRDGRGMSPLRGAGEWWFVADHRVERDVKVKVLEDQIGVWMRRGYIERERQRECK